MNIQAYRDEIITRLTGGVLKLDIPDSALDGCINAAFRQVQRYIDSTTLKTIPYKECMDLTGMGVSSVSRVYRTEGYMMSSNQEGSQADPMYMASWQIMSGGGINGMNQVSEWAQNYASYNTMMQMRSTMATDLAFRYDRHTNYLYVSCPFDKPSFITIEYIPRYNSVDEIVSDFWIDIQLRLSLAICKQTIGRVRKKFSQSNALWSLDTDILQEGLDEEKELQEMMRKATQLGYPID